MGSFCPVQERKRLVRIIQIGVSLIIAAVIFVGVLPKIADYSAVGSTIEKLSWFELVTLAAAAGFATAMFWPQLTASLPGLMQDG